MKSAEEKASHWGHSAAEEGKKDVKAAEQWGEKAVDSSKATFKSAEETASSWGHSAEKSIEHAGKSIWGDLGYAAKSVEKDVASIGKHED